MIPAVDVWLAQVHNDVLVGRAYFNLRRGVISCTFSYDQAYLARADSFSIDPLLPLNSSSLSTSGLPGAFRDSAPDRWGRHLVVRQEALRAQQEHRSPKTLDEVDFLLGVHDVARQGALRFSEPDSSVRLSGSEPVPPVIDLPELLAASTEIARGHEGAEQVKELLDAGSGSLGGARPKVTVVDDTRLLLAKFSHPGDEWDVMAWEKTALDMASCAGIAVPSSKLVRIGDQSVLLLERFDRRNAQGGNRRIPYMSAMTLLSSHDGDPRDYIELSEAVPLCMNKVAQVLENLFSRIVFSILIHNTDDHLRNTGFLRSAADWRFSPVFDVNPNPSLEAHRVTSIYGESGEREAQALAEVAGSFGMKADRAQCLVKDMLGALRGWSALARKNGCSDSEISMFACVIDNRRAALCEAFGL